MIQRLLQKTNLLTVPLTAFLVVFFVLPMVWFASHALRDAEVPTALPQTLATLEDWSYEEPLPEAVFPAFATDLVAAREAATVADAARRINYELTGTRSAIMKAARQAARAGDNAVFDAAFFEAVDPELISPEFFSVLKRAGGPLTDYYLLTSLDLQRDAAGHLERVPEQNRLYIDVLIRTLTISLTVMLVCLAMGFPVAVLLATASERLANWVMILVLLPFWTSILVRTTAWVVLLQREGLVNSLLIKIGLIAEPLTLIYNRSGVIIAMAHVLLPFMILPLYGILKGIPDSYMRAAMSLGARPVPAFFRVYLPLAMPGIAAGSLMVFILSVGYYVTPSLVGGASDQMLSSYVAQYTSVTGNWGLASALGLVLLLVTIGLYTLSQRLSGGRSVSFGGV